MKGDIEGGLFMSGRRRRKAYKRYDMDLSSLSEGVFISNEYKNAILAIAAAALSGLLACGVIIGYLLGKRD